MELVYLWIEEYKNIKNQGFNFSPRFRCEFKPKFKENSDEIDYEKSELVIKENENYVNIFPENINITAIVGKNGAGKSSVLEVLSLVSMEDLYINILAIFEEKNKFYLFNNFDYEINCNLKLEKVSLNEFSLNTVFFSTNFTNGILDEKYNYFSTPKYKFFLNEENKEINFRNQSLFSFFINSTRFFSNFLDNSAYKIINAVNIYQLNEHVNLSKKLIILDFIYYFPLHHFTPKELYLELIKSDIEIKFDSEDVKKSIEKFINENFSPILSHMIENLESHPNYEKIIDIKNKIFSLIDKKSTYFNKSAVILPMNIGLEFIHLFIKLLFWLDLDKIVKLPFEINFKELSNGEENFLLMIALIELGIKSFFKKNNKSKEIKVYLLLDEIETNFHPNWQKNLIIRFITYLSLINKYMFEYKLKCHLIFATHSPFIISDLPKENIIFLDKDENGKCKVVDGLNEKKETFGANIHTLLSDSFFMEDGFIGKFAENKINQVIKYLNRDETEINTDEEAQKIINLIGEPIIRNELQRRLNSKILEKINNINEKIKLLEYELEILKKHQAKCVKDELLDRGKKEYFLKKKDEKNNNN